MENQKLQTICTKNTNITLYRAQIYLDIITLIMELRFVFILECTGFSYFTVTL